MRRRLLRPTGKDRKIATKQHETGTTTF